MVSNVIWLELIQSACEKEEAAIFLVPESRDISTFAGPDGLTAITASLLFCKNMTSDKIPEHQEPIIDYKAYESYVVVQFHSWFNFCFSLFLGMVMYNLVPRSPTAKGKGDLTFQYKTE